MVEDCLDIDEPINSDENAYLAPIALQYEPGERSNVWQAAYHLGYRHIIDTSAPGAGKSFDAGKLTPEMFDGRQVIYVSQEHRNPTTPTLKDWPDLEARHQGLYRDEFGKLRRVANNRSYVFAPNCGRNEEIAALRAKNIPGANTASLVCATCPHLEPCRLGQVFGFLHDRANALKQPRLRAHPDSLPDSKEYDYRYVTLVWEEASEILKGHRSITVTDADCTRTIADLVALLPGTFDALRALLTTLHLYLSGQINPPDKYGWGDAQIRQALPPVGNLDLDEIRKALTPDSSRILNTTQADAANTFDIPHGMRKQSAYAAQPTAVRIANELPLNWLPDFLSVLLGKQVGSLRIRHGVLTISLADGRLADIAAQAAFNIYLDATATAVELARPLGLADSRQILMAQQVTQKTNNLEVIQVTTLGRLGLSPRSAYCSGRIDAVLSQIRKEALGEVATIDFKRHTNSGDGKRHWWVDSRSINSLETCSTLILVGTPCRNLGELEAEFTVLYGRPPQQGGERVRYTVQLHEQLSTHLQDYFEMEVSADPEFRQFVRRDILANYHQAIGRLRASRRPQETLKVYVIADYPLDFPVVLMKASDITLDAATKKERAVGMALAAAQELIAKGRKLTQSAVSQTTKLLDPLAKGYSQQYISQLWDLLQLLLRNNFYSESSKS